MGRRTMVRVPTRVAAGLRDLAREFPGPGLKRRGVESRRLAPHLEVERVEPRGGGVADDGLDIVRRFIIPPSHPKGASLGAGALGGTCLGAAECEEADKEEHQAEKGRTDLREEMHREYLLSLYRF